MVKDLTKGMRVTVVNHLFDMPISIVDDVASRSLTIVEIDASEGNFTGFDGLKPHTLVTKTFVECGIPDGTDGWNTQVCTMLWEVASDLERAFISATRVSPFNRQLVGAGLQPTTPHWVKSP
ncbi:MAG: hypothetical protein JWN26_442 [Candidatus Saccharibacteria bacterium]|nr:hypothetical protein [Candidatus Saccharibacteria bacterium]